MDIWIIFTGFVYFKKRNILKIVFKKTKEKNWKVKAQLFPWNGNLNL